MVRPQPRPSLAKAPTKEHPLAPAKTPGEPPTATPATDTEQPSALSASRRRASASAASPADASRSAAGEGPALTMFATRLDADLRRRVKVHAAQQNQTIQEVNKQVRWHYESIPSTSVSTSRGASKVIVGQWDETVAEPEETTATGRLDIDGHTCDHVR